MSRVGLAEDIEHDPTYRKQRELAAYVIGASLNLIRGVGFFEKHPDDPKKWAKEIADLAIQQGLVTFDDWHHAPMCPANHFHRARLPTGPCNCGAKRRKIT